MIYKCTLNESKACFLTCFDKKDMNKLIFIRYAAIFILLNSCNQQEKKGNNFDSSKEIPKNRTVKEIISKLDSNIPIDALDLSHQGLLQLPDLSSYSIKKLNISGNKLDTIPLSLLPKNLEKLDASKNNIKQFGIFNGAKSFGLDAKLNYSEVNLKEINLSYNKLISFNLTILDNKCQLKKANLSNNELIQIQINCAGLHYLNISDNINLSNEIDVDTTIDTIIRNNIKNNLPLKRIMPWPREKKPIIISFYESVGHELATTI
jgi:hypothetical protein